MQERRQLQENIFLGSSYFYYAAKGCENIDDFKFLFKIQDLN